MTTLEEIFGIKKSHSKTLNEQAGRESLKLHALKLRDTSSLSGKNTRLMPVADSHIGQDLPVALI
tara:strand:+ start:1048 stop:1242 length:195 start_codon:yes stop_codon:yes gene_type:complete